mmetsp:Transcript_92287/g.152867  ORF Transcript_92287/g.152867 Transcript_92287/m.152867 type:complete len:213 (-) Transcript_92287:8-646(-)
MSRKAAEFFLQPGAQLFSRFRGDFAKLGVAVAGRPRHIYISLSSIFYKWDKEGEACLSQIPEDALFFFGSKRSWVFPENEAEVQESRRNSSRYTKPDYQKIRDLILKKEGAQQVFFLKPPGFKYNGDLFHGDPAAFHIASKWLTGHLDPVTGKPYSPLILQPDWWRTEFDRFKAKYTNSVDTIIKNFECGAHDYNPVKELLYQSNPSLEIKH